MNKIPSSEITPERVYLNRRQFMKAAAFSAGALALAACGVDTNSPSSVAQPTQDAIPPVAGAQTDELGDPLTDFEAVTNYNNYYEFSMDKEAVAPRSKDFQTRPWTLEVGGLVNKPKTYAIEDILAKFPRQERIYRLRCVEAWSMVIPWLGFPIKDLLDEVEPTGDAKYVRFETLLDPEQMPGQKSGWYSWPYVEGLRLDEAMNDLAILSTGLYGKELLPQNGAPIRLVVPWKYGFYANVNPEVDHPRWSQSSERRIGEGGRRKTLMFNSYEDEVASLYSGMDLRVNY